MIDTPTHSQTSAAGDRVLAFHRATLGVMQHWASDGHRPRRTRHVQWHDGQVVQDPPSDISTTERP